jgi:hypothetical protein
MWLLVFMVVLAQPVSSTTLFLNYSMTPLPGAGHDRCGTARDLNRWIIHKSGCNSEHGYQPFELAPALSFISMMSLSLYTNSLSHTAMQMSNGHQREI